MSNPVPLELQAKIQSWRLRAAEGTLSLEDCREGISFLRAGRIQAAQAASSARSKTRSVAPAADDMLSDLEGL